MFEKMRDFTRSRIVISSRPNSYEISFLTRLARLDQTRSRKLTRLYETAFEILRDLRDFTRITRIVRIARLYNIITRLYETIARLYEIITRLSLISKILESSLAKIL